MNRNYTIVFSSAYNVLPHLRPSSLHRNSPPREVLPGLLPKISYFFIPFTLHIFLLVLFFFFFCLFLVYIFRQPTALLLTLFIVFPPYWNICFMKALIYLCFVQHTWYVFNKYLLNDCMNEDGYQNQQLNLLAGSFSSRIGRQSEQVFVLWTPFQNLSWVWHLCCAISQPISRRFPCRCFSVVRLPCLFL